MSAIASLKRFGEEDPFSINWRSCIHCLQSEWPLLKVSVLTGDIFFSIHASVTGGLKSRHRGSSHLESGVVHTIFQRMNTNAAEARTKNLTIFNIIRWFAGLLGQMTQRPGLLFFSIISCKILCKKYIFLLFLYEIAKMKIKSFECPNSIGHHG